MLAERWRQSQDGDRDSRLHDVSASPRMLPDRMPQPVLPDLGRPRQISPDQGRTQPPDQDQQDDTDQQPPAQDDPGDPADQDPGTAQDPDAPPDLDQTDPGSDPHAGAGDAGRFRTFATSLTDSLCKKLSECGIIDGSTRSMCQVVAGQMNPDDAAERVARGECSFDQSAADACLRAVASLRCDTQSGGDMMAWLMESQRVGQCARAYVCQ